jgi:hypothetical protein
MTTPKKNRRSRPRKGTATPTDKAKARPGGIGETAASEGAPIPLATSARPDEPPPSLIPPEVQAELDRLKMVNRALRGALRSFLEEEP